MLTLYIVVVALVQPAQALRPADLRADARSPHSRIDLNQAVALLNRHTFNTTVKQEHVDHWIVLFCVDWLEHCQGLSYDYKRLALHWERTLPASSWQTAGVRFAEVNCATDKALCNENGVETYPSMLHFQRGVQPQEWSPSRGATSLSSDISSWIRKELTRTSLKSHANASRTLASGSISTGDGGLISFEQLKELSALFSWRDPKTAAMGYVILATVVAVVAWVVGTGLEVEFQTVLWACAKGAKKSVPRPSALLPELPVMPQPRTIVRNSIIL